MNLNDALTQIAHAGGLDPKTLIDYAREDHIGGRDTGDWSPMSTFADEGKIIYALIRALKPEQVVEIGVDSGGTSSHILTALHGNERGHLYSVDIKNDVGYDMPVYLRNSNRWTLVTGQDALMAPLPERADVIFEDGPHTYEWTRDMLARLRTLDPECLLAHDAFMPAEQGFYVWEAFREIFPDGGARLKVGAAFSGLAYWFK